MLARPEWNEDRFEGPRKHDAQFFLDSSERYLRLLTLLAGFALTGVGIVTLL